MSIFLSSRGIFFLFSVFSLLPILPIIKQHTHIFIVVPYITNIFNKLFRMSYITKEIMEDIRKGKRELNVSGNLLLKDFFDKVENNFKVDSEITCIKASNAMITVCKDNKDQMNKYGNKDIMDIFSQEFITLSFRIGNSPKAIRVYVVYEHSKTPYMTVEGEEY